MIEVRKQILGIVIGIFITISFIGPVFSFNDGTNIFHIKMYDLIEILDKVNSGKYKKKYTGIYSID